MPDGPMTDGMVALVPESPGQLVIPGGDPAEDLHLTLAYLGDGVDQWDQKLTDAVKAYGAMLAADYGAIETRIMGHATWNMDGGEDGSKTPVAVYEVDCTPMLDELRESACTRGQAVVGEALWPDQHVPFKPHITAGWDMDTTAMTAAGPVRFTTLRVALGGEVADYPLTGSRMATDEPMRGYSGEGVQTMAETAVTEVGKVEGQVNPDGEMELHWPCLVLEGVRTGDGRFIPYGSLGARGLPLSVAGQVTNDEGHKGAEVFGKITRLERHEGPSVISKETGEPFAEGTAVWEAWGVGDPDSAPGKLALKGYLTGNSADIADATVEDELADGQPTRSLVGGKIGGTTLVPIPAFADGFVEINGKVHEGQPAVEPIAAAAWTLMDPDPAPLVASTTEDLPSVAWFADPKLATITPLTRRGRHVYGHVADWNRPHISFDGRPVFAARSRDDCKWFRTGAYPAVDESGEEVTVGVGRLTIGGGHAPLDMSHTEARRFYLDTTNALAADASTAWAYVAAGEDAHGIWVSGVTADGADEATIRRALAHPPSIDQRPIDGHLELVAAHCVNTAGIPIPRARVASGEVVALVAAGYVPPASDNPDVLADLVTERVLAGLVAYFSDASTPELSERLNTARLNLRISELTEDLELPFPTVTTGGRV